MPLSCPLLKIKPTHIFLVLLALAAFLRLYRINQIPYGFYWDEAAITYNAWGLAVWNRDEFGNKLPVSFKSFGDYKAPLTIYILGGIYKFTGLHPEYLRILISLSGIGVVVVLYFLTKEYQHHYQLPSGSALVITAFAAVTPWAVNFSRFGVEAMMALLLFLLGALALEKSRKQPALLFMAALFFVLCLYAYHSPKIVVPLFLLLWLLMNRKFILQNKAYSALATLIAVALLYPLIKDTLFGQGFERGKSLIFYNGNLSLFLQNLLSIFDLNFWIYGVDVIGLRHGVPGFGVLPKIVFGLMLLGVIVTLLKKTARFLIIWTFIGLLPSILSTDAPHAIRSLMALPPILMLSSFGFYILPKIIKPLAIIILSVETYFYVSTYYGSYAIQSATSFQYGYQQAILSAEKLAGPQDKIIVTDYYGQPYIYTLLYRKITPEEFKFGALANYEFHKISWPDDRPNRIYVATPDEITPTDPQVKNIIYIPNTSVPVFVVAKN